VQPLPVYCSENPLPIIEAGGSMKTQLRVLIVDNVEADAIQLMLELVRGGFDTDYRRVTTALEMQQALAEEKWDLILADFELSQLNGTEVLQLYRKKGSSRISGVSGSNLEKEVLLIPKTIPHLYN